MAYAAVLAFLWLAHHRGFSPAPFAADTYAWLYDHFYVRVDLQPGRLLDLAAPARGRLRLPDHMLEAGPRRVRLAADPVRPGQPLRLRHARFVVIAVANIPGLDRTSAWQGVVLHTLAIAVLWVLVRRRFLFSVVPR